MSLESNHCNIFKWLGFGHTAVTVITNKDESIDLKRAQEARNFDVYRTSIQYTVLSKIHGKEVYRVHPQDVVLLWKDQLDKNLRKSIKIHKGGKGWGNSLTTRAAIYTGTQISKSRP